MSKYVPYACMKPLIPVIIFLSIFINGIAVTLAEEPYKIALSEIQMLPQHTNDPVRIELVNRSEQSVDMSGWHMIDGYGHRYNFPKSLTVPKGALIVVAFGSEQVKGKDDLGFSDNVAYLYCNEPWSQNAFRGMKNECALYAPPAEGEQGGKVQDYLQWGSWTSESEAFKQSVDNKLWSVLDFVLPNDDETIPGGRCMRPGESLARRDFERQWMMSTTWFINDLNDVSFGVTNLWPVPRLLFPHDKMTHEPINPRIFIWDATCGTNNTFLFQISTNKNFVDVIFETETKEQQLKYTITEGKYYWRVCINAQKAERKWSNVSVFKVVDRSKCRAFQVGDPIEILKRSKKLSAESDEWN